MAVLGCIADDFTGASDAASFLVKGGLSVSLYNGIPDSNDKTAATNAQAMVIALKSRTQKTQDAVADSLAAAHFLQQQGARQIYFKYCSTFDSTPEGNIGPVADALMEELNAPYTLLCPALVVNGRTVENGSLMVNGIPLHESHMKNHPLTPMWDCRIDRLMQPQSKYPCVTLGTEPLCSFAKNAPREGRFYLIVDHRTDDDGEQIIKQFGTLPLLTGGSGLLEPLARQWAKTLSAKAVVPKSQTAGAALVLAGSCSKATLEQIAWYQAQGKPCYRLDPRAVVEGRQTLEDAWSFIQAHENREAVLVYSSDTPERVKESQNLGTSRVAAALEGLTAALAVRAVTAGYTRIISAGGETSGAVTKALGFCSYWMGQSVAPGVPIMVPVERPDIRLILKSGNFGQQDFFGRALAMTELTNESTGLPPTKEN